LIQHIFDYEKKLASRDQVAYVLATYMFDHNDDLEHIRKRMKQMLPPDVYLMALEHYLDGKHDT
jgi:hypothetical protein